MTSHSGFRLGQHIRLGSELARGTEGAIHEFSWLSGSGRQRPDAAKFVAKIYFKPSEEKAVKLEAMIANRPQDPTREMSIAWPKALVLDERGAFVGFIMPYVDRKETFSLLSVYDPQNRSTIRVYDKRKQRDVPCVFTWEYLLRMAYNLAEIVQELHSKGYVIGDLNVNKLLVTPTALVTLVGCDSVQVPRPTLAPDDTTAYFRCPVGKPEFTAPELQGQHLSRVVREAKHDDFGLAVLIFLLLMEGRHPFAGVWHGDGPPPPLVQNIREYNSPYVGSGKLKPPKNALLLETLPLGMQELMKRCFARQYNGAQQRPLAQEWVQALEEAENHLRECQLSSLHVYSEHLGEHCPWCARIQQGISDSFPSASMMSQGQTTGMYLPLSPNNGQASKPGMTPASAQAQTTGQHQPLAPSRQVTGQHQQLPPNNVQAPMQRHNPASAQAQTTGQHQQLPPSRQATGQNQPLSPKNAQASAQGQTAGQHQQLPPSRRATGQNQQLSPNNRQASMQGNLFPSAVISAQTTGHNPQVPSLTQPTRALPAAPIPNLGAPNPPSPPLQSAYLPQQRSLSAGDRLSFGEIWQLCCFLLMPLIYAAEVVVRS